MGSRTLPSHEAFLGPIGGCGRGRFISESGILSHQNEAAASDPRCRRAMLWSRLRTVGSSVQPHLSSRTETSAFHFIVLLRG